MYDRSVRNSFFLCGERLFTTLNHRDTENTEIAQRRLLRRADDANELREFGWAEVDVVLGVEEPRLAHVVAHAIVDVMNQPALPRATWEAEVRKMINVYKAPIDPTDVAAIVDYLAKTRGKS